MKLIIWMTFALLALMWSGAAWAVAAGLDLLAAWVASGQSADAGAWVAQWPVPAWMALWIDVEALKAVQLMVVDLMQWLRAAWPTVGTAVGWLVPLVWVVWGFGVLGLLALAVGLHWLVGRRGGGGSGGGTLSAAMRG